MPDGYLTSVAETGRSLSAGSVSFLSRSSATDRSEHPHTRRGHVQLDLAAEAQSAAAMNLASKGRTTLVIAHRLQTVHNASRIVVVDNGRVIEDGSHDDLIASGGRYAALWDAFDHATAPMA
jgi:ATP-binding cassette subfamily B protein